MARRTRSRASGRIGNPPITVRPSPDAFYDVGRREQPSGTSPLEAAADPEDTRPGNGYRSEPGRARTGCHRLLGVRVQEVVDVEESQHAGGADPECLLGS